MNKYILAVIGAGCCWGFTGFFTRTIETYGIGPTGIIAARCGVAAVCFGLLILFTGVGQFKIKLRDIWCFLGSGILSLLFFTFCYFNAMSIMSLSAAAILLYTAPTIVMILSVVLFKEKITAMKIAAVVLSFIGCCLVSGIGGNMGVSVKGILFGLGAGIGYALYTIFSRYALQRGYTGSTVNFYSCLLATAAAAVIWGVRDVGNAVSTDPKVIFWCVALGIVGCFIPYMLYTYGLTGTENSKASVVASTEPVVATLAGVFIYHEKLSAAAIIGIVLVLSAILVLNIKPIRKYKGVKND